MSRTHFERAFLGAGIRRLALFLLLLLAIAQPGITADSPRGLDFDVYIRLKTGMSEGELLARAGKPDADAVENIHGDIVKTYYYLPTTSNPWITTIKLRGGTIVSIDRDKKTF